MNNTDFSNLDLKPYEAAMLDLLQEEFPLCKRPFLALAEKVSVSEDDILHSVQRLLDNGIIRRLAGFFNPRSLGYISTLCAIGIPEDKIEDTAAKINCYSSVTHNYLRDNSTYNMWFTVIAGGNSEIDKTVKDISQKVGFPVADFRGTDFFKIKVKFSVGKDADANKEDLNSENEKNTNANYVLDEKDKKIINMLCRGVSVVSEPFKELSECVGLCEDDILFRIKKYKESGYMRRIGIAVMHTKLGYSKNCMVVWKVPEKSVTEAGKKMALDNAVSHCYCRLKNEKWQYNLYTMLHGKNDSDILDAIERIKQTTGITEYLSLPTIKEYKKTGMIYFD